MKLKGEIELSRITAVEAVDMEVLKGPFFQVGLKLRAVYCKVGMK